MTAWVIRIVDDPRKEDVALSESVIIAGWDGIADFSSFHSKVAIQKAISSIYPHKSDASISNWARQVELFRDAIRTGDFVVMPSKKGPYLHVGIVEGTYAYVNRRHTRPVTWWARLDKNKVITEAQGTLGTFMSIFRVEKPRFVEQVRSLCGVLSEPSSAGPRLD